MAGVLVASLMPALGAAAATTTPIITVGGAEGLGPGTEIAMAPSDIAVRGSTAYVADALYGVVRAIDLVSGVTTVVLRSENPAPAEAAVPLAIGGGPTPLRGQANPMGLAIDGSGTLIVSDRVHNRIRRLALDGTVTDQALPVVQIGQDPPSTQASHWAAGAAIDAGGNVYLADPWNHRVVKIDRAGSMTVIAGTGRPGFTGDGGGAVAAQLNGPSAVAIDPAGNLFIADTMNFRVRRVAASGTITTVAGGPPRVSGGGVDADCRSGPVSTTWLLLVREVAIDPDGSLLIGDGSCVRRLRDGGLTRLRGEPQDRSVRDASSEGAFFAPLGLAPGPGGSVLIADGGQLRVREVRSDGAVRTLAGRSAYTESLGVNSQFGAGEFRPTRSAQLAHVSGLASRADGTLFVADDFDHVVRSVAADGLVGPVTAAVGSAGVGGVGGSGGPASAAVLSMPSGLDIGPDGSLFVPDPGQERIYRIWPDGRMTTVAGPGPCQANSGENGPALLANPQAIDVAVDNEGSLLYLERYIGRLRKVSPGGVVTTLIGTTAQNCNGVTERESPLFMPTSVDVAPDGTIYVADARCLYRLTPGSRNPQCIARLTALSFAPFFFLGVQTSYPDVMVDGAGTVIFSDPYGHTVRRLTAGGDEVIAGTGRQGCGADSLDAATTTLSVPTRLALGLGGSVIVYEEGCHRLRRVGGSPLTPVLRLSGLDRVSTAVEISRSTFAAGSARAVVVARANDYADALAGTPLAVREGGPLLLSASDGLDAWTESEVRRVLRAGGTVHLLGGRTALGSGVEDRLRALGYGVARHAGDDRFATAVAIARALGDPRTVLVTTGTNFPDGVAAAAAAASMGAAILLTDGPRLPTSTTDYLSAFRPTTLYAIGGPAAAAAPTAAPIVGTDRYDTAARLAARFFPAPTAVSVASGTSFPDALSGGALSGRLGAPVVLTAAAELSAPADRYLADVARSVDMAYVYGGPSAVAGPVRDRLAALVGATS